MKAYPEDCLIIGVVGRAGAGKDELADYLHKKCAAHHLAIGDIARSIAEERGLEKTRQNLHQITREFQQKEGADYFIKQLIREINANIHELVVVSGIRSPMDASILREHYGDKFLLVAVLVNNPRVRFEHTQNRSDPRDVDTFEAFAQNDEQEEAMFQISQTLKQADVEIHNNKTLAEFHQIIERKLIAEKLDSYCQHPEGKG